VGLLAVAESCPDLGVDITNAALEAIGTYSLNLQDFRIVLLDRELMAAAGHSGWLYSP
jgi:coronatine-insensitive protein 1